MYGAAMRATVGVGKGLLGLLGRIKRSDISFSDVIFLNVLSSIPWWFEGWGNEECPNLGDSPNGFP